MTTSETGTDTGTTGATTAGPELTPAPARTPRAPAAAAYLGALLSLTLIAVGVVGIHDGIVAAGWIGGSSWTANTVNWIDGLRFAGWMLPAGIAAVILGVCLVIVAVAPRRTTAVALAGRTSIVIAHDDIARIAASAAQTVPGVTDARATSKRRRLTVRTHTTGQDTATVKPAVADAVRTAVSTLSRSPKIVVRTRTGGQS